MHNRILAGQSGRRALVLALIIILTGTLHPAANASAQEGLRLEARAGFDGYYKVSHWVPVHVIASNDGQDVEGEIRVSASDPYPDLVFHTQPAILPTQSRKHFTLYVYLDTYSDVYSDRYATTLPGASQ